MLYNPPMSEAITFDTHATVKKLMESGMPEKQAEAVVSVQVELVNSNLATKQDVASINHDIALVRQEIEQLRAATKQDIEELRAATKQDITLVQHDIALVRKEIEELRADLKRDMATLEARLVKWMAGFGLATIGLLVTLLLNTLN